MWQSQRWMKMKAWKKYLHPIYFSLLKGALTSTRYYVPTSILRADSPWGCILSNSMAHMYLAQKGDNTLWIVMKRWI